jgi:formylglycine-generating enzyme required for sulfatase activity
MVGNVWEWTRSLEGEYPYPNDAQGQAQREELNAPNDKVRVLRGGAFYGPLRNVRCAAHLRDNPYARGRRVGFRVVVLPCS